MKTSQLKTVAVTPGHDQPLLSKGQLAFNKLIKQIENKRERLIEWEAAIPRYQQKYTSDLLPLIEALVEAQVGMVHVLDRVSEKKGLSKSDRSQIADVIREVAGQILSGSDNAELKAIYNRHSRFDYDSEAAANLYGAKSMLEDMLGVELGDDLDGSSPEEMLKRLQAQMEAEMSQHDAERQAWEDRRPHRKKTAKQLAKEARQQAEEQQASLSIREVYRKLASAFHPDREPDLQERERKTALMQRVNDAYEKRNLLELLKLQLELEHIDQNAFNNISEDRLKHYSRILKEQLAELEQEIIHVENEFTMRFGIDPFERISPATIMRELAGEIVDIQNAIHELKKDMVAFEDVKIVKIWLKKLRRHPVRRDDFDDCPF